MERLELDRDGWLDLLLTHCLETGLGRSRLTFIRDYPPSQAALARIRPGPDPVAERARPRVPLTGELPSPTNPPSGCRFRTRCPVAQAACAVSLPAPVEVATGHRAACLFVGA